MADGGGKSGREAVNPGTGRTMSAVEGGQGMEDCEQPVNREVVERQLEDIQLEGEGLVEEVKVLQARVSKIKEKLAQEDGRLPSEEGWDEDSHSRIQRLEQRAEAEEQRLAEMLESKADAAQRSCIEETSDDVINPHGNVDIEISQAPAESLRSSLASNFRSPKIRPSLALIHPRPMSPVRFSDLPSEDRPPANSPGLRTNAPGASSVRDRHSCRLGIEVVGIQVKEGCSLPSCHVKLIHGPLKEKIELASGEGYIGINHKCSLEVKEKNLEVRLRMRRTKHLGSNELARAIVDLDELHSVNSADAMRGDNSLPEPLVLTLVDNKGNHYEPVVSLTLRIVKVRCPEPDENINILVGTWNMADNVPPSKQILQDWLLPEKVQQAGLVVVGTQESQYTRPRVEGVEFSTEQDWVDTICDVIGETHTMYRGMSMGKTRIFIWARLDVLAGIQHYKAADKWTGSLVTCSSKGGVAALLSVWDTTILFVNSHLAAHMGASFLARRNQDYSDIAGGISLGDPDCGLLNQFHHCIWVGDVNYRLDLSDTFGEAATEMKPSQECHAHVQTMIKRGKLAELLHTDELRAARERGEAFVGFEEGLIEHPPTFKVRQSAGVHYVAKRLPAYTDRIQWRSLLPSLRTRCLHLWCAHRVATSDHKPVAALLEVDLRPPRPEWWPRVGGDAHVGDARVQKRAHKHYLSPFHPFNRSSSLASTVQTRVPSSSGKTEHTRTESGAGAGGGESGSDMQRRASSGHTESGGEHSVLGPLRPAADANSMAFASAPARVLAAAQGEQHHNGSGVVNLSSITSRISANSGQSFKSITSGVSAHSSKFGKSFLGLGFSFKPASTFHRMSTLNPFARTQSTEQTGVGSHKSDLYGFALDVESMRGQDLAAGSNGLTLGGTSIMPYRDGTGNPDACVTFYSELLAQPVRSNVVRNSSSPLWDCADLSLSLSAPSLESLQWEYIVVAVKHSTREGTADVPLGTGLILLSELLEDLGESVELTVPLMNAGLPKGSVHCTVKLEPAGPVEMASFKKARQKANDLLKQYTQHQRGAGCWPCSWLKRSTLKPAAAKSRESAKPTLWPGAGGALLLEGDDDSRRPDLMHRRRSSVESLESAQSSRGLVNSGMTSPVTPLVAPSPMTPAIPAPRSPADITHDVSSFDLAEWLPADLASRLTDKKARGRAVLSV